MLLFVKPTDPSVMICTLYVCEDVVFITGCDSVSMNVHYLAVKMPV